MPWVMDGLDARESEVIQDLLYFAVTSRPAVSSIVGLDWVRDGIEDLEAGAIHWLNNFRDAEGASLVVDLAWVRDGIEEVEVKAIQQLSFIVHDDAELASSVIGLGWVQDGIEDIEWQAIRWVNNFDGGDVATSVVALAWMQDGVDDLEVNAIKELFFIDHHDSGVASSVVKLDWMQEAVDEKEFRAIEEIRRITRNDAGEALRIVAMPFLETLEPPDISALDSLSALATFRHDDFQRVLSHPTLSDGITDDWAKIVATLYGVSKNNSDLVDTLLDPDRVTLEERVIELPLAGETHLAIIRTNPGAAGSIDLLEHAVRNAEDFMGVSLPNGYIALLFGEAVTPTFSANNFGTHIAALPKYDVDDGSNEAEFASLLIPHEVAHYYWRGNANWVDEGIAQLMLAASENARIGRPIEVSKGPCPYARTIAELENLDVTSEDGADSAFTCNYALGERLFIDLYRSMDEDSFREGLRDLYLLSQVADEDEGQDDTKVGIEHLKAAFKGGDAENPIVNTIAARWYNGTEPYNVSARDDSPADPRLRTVNGRIDRAYLAAVYKGPPTTSFSAQAAHNWVRLFLEFSYSVGSDTEVPLELVHYYEDGFEFRRRTVTFTADARHNSSLRSKWLLVGQSPSKLWAPGEYRLHVYNEGRKLVELEYEVTP